MRLCTEAERGDRRGGQQPHCTSSVFLASRAAKPSAGEASNVRNEVTIFSSTSGWSRHDGLITPGGATHRRADGLAEYHWGHFGRLLRGSAFQDALRVLSTVSRFHGASTSSLEMKWLENVRGATSALAHNSELAGSVADASGGVRPGCQCHRDGWVRFPGFSQEAGLGERGVPAVRPSRGGGHRNGLSCGVGARREQVANSPGTW
ncbi:hypothetical protein SAMN04487820_10933 [Actinopolyspora mzabensis]|uniref:Uncharacterized protein n=1 Tax=Actinopolyspora mzabensis TaxID=995066 RepID=A0A1G9CQ03_ACTMZ|nr:hypothetical protein SAMN04487820_10933 [Actinopolyspora mzabensis]